MKQFVIMYVNTITSLTQAIWSDSLSESPDFSPRALAMILQYRLIVGQDLIVG